jgi:hypothetical protein
MMDRLQQCAWLQVGLVVTRIRQVSFTSLAFCFVDASFEGFVVTETVKKCN